MRPNLSTFCRREFLLLAGTACRLRALDTDFWNTKPPSEWTVGDIYQLMNHSPWANTKYSSTPGFAAPDLGLNRTGPRGLTQPPNAGQTQLGPRAVVTWESAQPIRDAVKTRLPDVFAGCYVIGVEGMPLGETSFRMLKTRTRLRAQGKQKWSVTPFAVREIDRTSPVYFFGFRKALAPLTPDNSSVLFDAQFGRWVVEVKFRPRDMLYRGELAL